MPTLTDARYDALRVLLPGSPPHINDLLRDYLLANGGTGVTLGDLWYSFFIANGATPGHRNDMVRQFLDSQGFTQPQLNDAWLAFWVAGGSLGPPALGDRDLGSIDITSLTLDESWDNPQVSSKGLLFNDDGTRLFISVDDTDVIEYSMVTPYDIGNTVLVGSHTPLQTNRVAEMRYNADGTKVFLNDFGTFDVFAYDLVTPYDISEIAGQNADEVLDLTVGSIAMEFANGGTLLVTGDTNTNLKTWDLSVAWDISTAVANETNLAVPDIARFDAMFISDDGTLAWLQQVIGVRLYQYTLSTPYDMTTLAIDTGEHVDLTSVGGAQFPSGNFIPKNRNEMYCVWNQSTHVQRYVW